MHIQGTPKTMQNDPVYEDLLDEIYNYIESARKLALCHGIDNDKIIIDPGIGFGKTVDDNYRIITNLQYLKRMGLPILIGISRKSLISKLYNSDSDRLPATIALNSISIINGANIIRVHDVKEHHLAIAAIDMLKIV